MAAVSKTRRRIQWAGILLVAPYVLYMLVFWVYPFIWGGVLSLQNWVLPGEAPGSYVAAILNPDVDPEFIGLKNFKDLFSFEAPQVEQAVSDDGELLYRCGRSRVAESELGEYTDETCTPLYANASRLLSLGYKELLQINLFGNTYVIGTPYPLFWNALWVTVKFMLIFIPSVFVGSMGLAAMLQRIKSFQGLYIAGYLSSYVVSGVAYSAVFKTMLARDGLVDRIGVALTGTHIGFFSDPNFALISIALIVSWKFIGYYGLIFLSGLNNISKDIYEAAKLDGANVFQRFTRITIPLLNPSIVVVAVFGIILSFNIFTEPFLITGGTPNDTTSTFMLQIYRTTFEDLRVGLGAAMAIVMAVMSFLTMMFVRRAIERDVSL
ncbi:sugar ABC transporter permease [Phototrophicus methaneseepsis]|uniref:Sugar ABC transporter permease n=1 Tax=Phototrophicus methaneseepsis TaxID=2710758 RepID=A0A7S8E8I0_9CHLR|nr:sugar ABC transporter permease [Phototrophicus methaneseepsis]QPC82360.1 sugar ABC transporter permease [Phototrophicus methaneseepsis]